MMSDYFMNKPVEDSAHLFSQYGDHPVYYYHYIHKGQFSLNSLEGMPPSFNQGIPVVFLDKK